MSWFIDLRPLRSGRAFRSVWLGSTLAAVGRQITNVAVLLQVWELTRSPVWTGAIGLATALPLLVFGPLGGALADALDRRRLILLTVAGQSAGAAGLAVQAIAGNRSVMVLLGLLAVYSTCSALGSAAWRTLPARLLPGEQVTAGIALHTTSFQAAMLTGPALAGFVITWSGAQGAYLVQAVACGLSLSLALALPRLPVTGARAGRGPAPGGWSVILRRPALSGSLLTDLAATVLAMPVALFPLVNEIRFGGDPRTLGLFLSAIAVGGLAAGLLSGTVTRLPRSGLVQLLAATVWGLALAGFGLAGPLWAALACLTVAGAADSVSVITRGALVQLETPDEYRGRVSSVEHVIGVAGPEAGNFRGGLLAALIPAPSALVVGGLTAAAAVAAIGLLNRPLRAYRTPAPATVA
ncbi:MFS transporter [Nonomuraea longicatena]|uniref:MFS transporter n=1 Tax=Nonomuraea longicatena TaxID=83682 RepID=A0ABP3Z1S7_9ACTN